MLRSPRTPSFTLPAHWSAHRRRDACNLLVILLLGIGTILLLSNVGAPSRQGSNGGQTSTSPTALPATTSAPSQLPANVSVHDAHAQLYPFLQTNVGLMQPAVDAQGNAWVGEMFANRLARLDSHSGVVTTWQPPAGRNGLMSTAVDTHGAVWYVEQASNYIGRFDPRTQAFRVYPLGTVGGRTMGPQDLQFDAAGQLWFTAAIGGRIGRLDPATGAVQTWPVPAPRPGVAPAPFSLTVTRDEQIWFGDITGGAVGRLDPTTGRVTLYHLADPQAEVFSMASDARGRIWFTEIVPGKLGMVDGATGRVTELPVPALTGHPAALYGLVVTPDGAVWFANNGAGALVRYAPARASFTFARLPQSSGGLYGLTLDAAGTLWFTLSGTTTNAVGSMRST